MSQVFSWSKIKRWLKQHRVGHKVLVVAAILLVAAIGYAVIKFWPADEVNRTVSATQQVTDVDSYERVIETGSVSECVQFIKTLADNRDAPLAVRIDNLKKKGDLALRIIEKSSDKSSENIGHLNRLEAAFKLERLLNLNGSSTGKTSQQLSNQEAQNLAGSEDAKISRLANLVLIYRKAFELSTIGGQPEESAIADLRDKMIKFAEKFPDDSYAVLQLRQYAGELQRAGRMSDSYELMVALSDAYSDSNHAVIAKIVAQVELLKHRKKYGLSEGNSREVEKFQEAVLAKNLQKADELIAKIKSNPGESDRYLELLNCCMLITQAGYPEAAIDLVQKSSELFEHDAVSAGRKQQFEDFAKLVGQVGSKLTFSDALASELREQPTLLFLVPSTKADKLYSSLKSIGTMTRQMIEVGNLDVIAVFIEEESGDRLWPEFSNRAEAFPGIRLRRLSVEDSKSFLANFPISWIPNWILLDDQKRLSQINPPIQILEEMLLNIIEEKTP